MSTRAEVEEARRRLAELEADLTDGPVHVDQTTGERVEPSAPSKEDQDAADAIAQAETPEEVLAAVRKHGVPVAGETSEPEGRELSSEEETELAKQIAAASTEEEVMALVTEGYGYDPRVTP